jgi:hypothetical protein
MQLRQLETRDQVCEVDQCARGCFQYRRGRAVPECERDQRQVGRDWITHRGKQIPGLELIGEQVEVVGGQTGQQRIDGVGDLIRDLTTFMSVDEAGIRLRER